MGEEEDKKEKEEAPKTEKQGGDEKMEEKEAKAAQAPPPPPEIVLKVYMHCEGCARKVRRCLKGFEGVEEVITDCRASKVVVKGEKADPLKVFERVQKKSHRPVELISPIPKPEEIKKKPEEIKVVKVEEKQEELPVITVVLGVYMHCEACSQEIKKRIQKMKGVESVEPDLKTSQVTVKGAFDPTKLTDYVHKRTGKHAVIINSEPAKKEPEPEKKEPKPEQKTAETAAEPPQKTEAKKEEKEPITGAPPPAAEPESEESKLEVKKNEFFPHPHPQNYLVYPQMPVQELYGYAPHIFSDENPNACSVM